MKLEIHPSECVDAILGGSRFIDVRAEVEFENGHVPGSLIHPILRDAERAAVGARYKEYGQASAVELGNRIVSGSVREERIDLWVKSHRELPIAGLMCARGGLRSRIAQSWMHERGADLPRVAGGYKALRAYLTAALEDAVRGVDFVILNGRTGVGKTRVLHQVQSSHRVLDLEQLAHHRGSAFGRLSEGQPAQSTFENSLSLALLGLARKSSGAVLVEAESQRIGNVRIPDILFDQMQKAPMIVLELPISERIKIIFEDYIEYPRKTGTTRNELLGNFVRATDSLRKRLGNERCDSILAELRHSFREDSHDETLAPHREWIRSLLEEYYDPLYERHFGKSDRLALGALLPHQFLGWLGEVHPTSSNSYAMPQF